MSKTKQTYKLGNIKQLIDLNRNVTNFDLNFAVVSKDNSEFYAVVVDQTTLDNNPDPDYKKVNGKISGNIVADKGVYQNYFLLLKSDKPCECDVMLELREIPKRVESVNQPVLNKTELNRANALVDKRNENRDKTFIVVIIIVAILCIGGYFYFRNKNQTVIEQKISDNVENSMRSRSPSIASSDYRFSNPFDSRFR